MILAEWNMDNQSLSTTTHFLTDQLCFFLAQSKQKRVWILAQSSLGGHEKGPTHVEPHPLLPQHVAPRAGWGWHYQGICRDRQIVGQNCQVRDGQQSQIVVWNLYTLYSTQAQCSTASNCCFSAWQIVMYKLNE